MTRWSLKRLALTLALSAALWAIVATLCLCVGSTGHVTWPTGETRAFRLENVLLASLIGAALASAGVAYQAILRNPLADPYLLGVSSGAAMGAYLWRFPTIAAALIIPAALSQQAFAFLGGAIAVAIVFTLGTRRGRLDPITLLLVGVIVNAVNGSLFMFLNSFYKDLPGAGSPLAFLIGALQTTLTTSQKTAALICIATGWILLLYISGSLNAAVLTESEATSLGIRIHRLRWIALIVASLMTASAVAISGPIGFVGLVCPHLARLFVGQDHRRLLPVATALGAALLCVADAATRLLAQDAYAQTLLPVGVLTGLLGGPFFLLLLWNLRRSNTAGGAT